MAVPVNLLDDDDDEAPTAMAPLAGAGFVQGNAMYTVMDDLKVVPMSTISAITLLNTLGVLNIGVVEQKTVQLGYDEVTIHIYAMGNYSLLLHFFVFSINFLFAQVFCLCVPTFNNVSQG
jgi:hypothetical protein